MEYSNLMIILPVVAIGAVLIVAFLMMSRQTTGSGNSETRDCPHCKKTVEEAATECGFCLRKIVHI